MCLSSEDMNELVDRLEHTISGRDLTQELCDLPDFSMASHLLQDIADCVGVKMWLTSRQETNMNGETETCWFYEVFGTRVDVETACWLFERVEDTVGERTAAYVNKYVFSLSDSKILKFQQAELASIQRQLRETIDYTHDAKEAVIAPAFARLEIKFVRTKPHHDYSTAAKAYTGSVSIT